MSGVGLVSVMGPCNIIIIVYVLGTYWVRVQITHVMLTADQRRTWVELTSAHEI